MIVVRQLIQKLTWIGKKEKRKLSETEEIAIWVDNEIKQLSKSVLRLALLSIIKKNQHEGIHGYLIGEKLYSETEGQLDGTKATFYAILRRLEQDSLIETKIGEQKSGPPRKYYQLSTKGERAYQALWQNWRYFYSILYNLIEDNS
jgi:PadR family transcriptional regulator PadR